MYSDHSLRVPFVQGHVTRVTGASSRTSVEPNENAITSDWFIN
jgi:hypothetical protein